MTPHDYHLHTHFSGDNQSDMEAMCRSAIARGIPEIAFTEHFDVNPNEPQRNQFPLEAWSIELARCRALFDGQLVTRAGLEASEPHTAPEAVADLLARYPFDFVIGSLHWMGDEIIFDAKYFQRPMDEAYRMYFVELERMTRQGEFDVLGHLDVVTRLGHQVYGEYDPRRYEDILRPALRNCIERGIVLEINTGNMRRSIRATSPGMEILRWYVEMGGEVVILGSDAHRPEVVGLHLDTALELARAVGLKYLARFERGQAQRIPLF
jgi:histidinol-phosphatase (PHP family)